MILHLSPSDRASPDRAGKCTKVCVSCHNSVTTLEGGRGRRELALRPSLYAFTREKFFGKRLLRFSVCVRRPGPPATLERPQHPRASQQLGLLGVGILLKLVLKPFPQLTARRWPLLQKRRRRGEPVAM